jgi:hypothetical protein
MVLVQVAPLLVPLLASLLAPLLALLLALLLAQGMLLQVQVLRLGERPTAFETRPMR